MGCACAKAAAPTAAAKGREEELPSILGTSGGESPHVGDSLGKGAVAAATAVGLGASSAMNAVGSGAKQVKNGAVGVASQVGHGAAGAFLAVGHGAQHIGQGAAGAVLHAGHGAVAGLSVVGHGAHHIGHGAAGVVRHAGQRAVKVVEHVGWGAVTQIEPEVEKSWFDQVHERILSWEPCAFCCQHRLDGNVLGSLIKSMVEKFDASTLGVEVEIGSLVFDAAVGRVNVDSLTVFNPEGYHSEYLLHAEKVVVDIDMQKLLYSLGKELHVEELFFDGIDVKWEQGLHSSNLQDLQRTLESYPCLDSSATSEVKVVLHTILAQNIGAKLTTKLTRGHGPRVEVATLRYDDFDKEMGGLRSSMGIARILLQTLIKSVLATVVGKHGARAIAGACSPRCFE